MDRRAWIIVLIVIGVALAVVVGLLGARGKGGTTTTTAMTANESLCTSLTALETSTMALTSLDPSTATKSQYQSGVSTVKSDWSQVVADAKTVASTSMSSLDAAWNSFASAVQSVPGSASVSTSLQDVSTQGKALVTTVQSTFSSLGC